LNLEILYLAVEPPNQQSTDDTILKYFMSLTHQLLARMKEKEDRYQLKMDEQAQHYQKQLDECWVAIQRVETRYDNLFARYSESPPTQRSL
jgi:hypothetical protein